MLLPMKLELGAGLRPTRGYTHHDMYPHPHIELFGDPWMLDLPTASCDEVLALAFIEHLTYEQALDTFRNVKRMLKPSGVFLFDVPDYPKWVEYYLRRVGTRTGTGNAILQEDGVPPIDLCRQTLFGWGRFPGYSHLYGWDQTHLAEALTDCGLSPTFTDSSLFRSRAYRRRFSETWNAHLYVQALPS